MTPLVAAARRRLVAAFVLALLAAGGGAQTPAQPEDPVRSQIAAYVEQIRSGNPLTVGGAAIASRVVLPAFYERRGLAPAWADPATRADLLRAIAEAEKDGLDPENYHRERLAAVEQRAAGDPRARADQDLLFTDALIRLGYHLVLGRVDPSRLDPNWNLRGDLGGIDPAQAVEQAIASGKLFDVIESYKPRHPLYLGLKAALADYRARAARGGWESVPDLAKLAPGASDARIPALRRRLAASDDLAATASLTSELYDPELEAAVRRFQVRHGLLDDGKIGPRTMAAINVPIEQRIQQIRLNLERARWVLRGLEDDFVAVNVASFRVYVVRDNQAVWTTRAVVGKLQHESPIFKSSMTHIVLNPTWTVPASIARSELLPQLRRNRGYLASKHMVLLDASGRQVDAAAVDLSRGAGFPYLIRQDPGPWNALGQAKFVFPNEHSVYLHDTPSRQLFASEARAFSHGCIRVEDPLKLAEVLLQGQEGWDRAAIDAVIASQKTRTISLAQPLPVLVLYWTAWVNPEGELKFYEDVYHRDARVLQALDEDYGRDIDARRAGLED
jgi:murein L,D-transpeptidase YcbB/YkuD